MSIFLKLTMALIKTVEPGSEEKKYKKIFYRIMGFIAVFGIMLPMAFLVGVIIYTLTAPLAEIGSGTNAVELFLHLVSVFSFVFGINVIFTVFYFSGDIENLLPLPLSPYQIIGSKFTAALISESIMEFIVILAAFAGYIIAAGVPFYSWIIALFGMLTLPVIPLVYCGIICMLLMLITGFIKNKDTVNKITGVMTFAAVIIIAFLISGSGGFDTEHLLSAISDPNNSIINTMNFIFPHIGLIVDAMVGNTFINILFYIAVNAAAIALFMLTARLVYFRTVTGINGARQTKHKSFSSVSEKIKRRSAPVSYLKKEFKLLFRTPAYFSNCIIINLIWPVFLYLIYLLQGKTNFLDSFIYNIHNGDEETVLVFLLGVSAVSVLITAANSIASSALTREGKHFAFIKYIPMSYMAQLNVKALVSIIISGAGMILYVAAAAIYLNLGIKLTVCCCLLSLLSVSFVSYFGIFMDSVNPKLIWDDELNALRGNYNIFFNMAIAILLEAATCAGAYLLFKFTNFGALMIIIILFIFIMLLNALSYLLCSIKATKNIDSLSF